MLCNDLERPLNKIVNKFPDLFIEAAWQDAFTRFFFMDSPSDDKKRTTELQIITAIARGPFFCFFFVLILFSLI